MASRFRHEVTVVPVVRIAVGSQGLRTTIGGNSGALASGGGQTLRHYGDHRLSGPLPTDRFLIPGTRKDYGGGDLTTMTSPGLDSFKELLLAARQRQREITADLGRARRQRALAWTARALGWISCLSVASKAVRAKASNALAVRRSEVACLAENLSATTVRVDFDMETAVAGPHRRMQDAFDQMARSQKSWNVQTEQQIDRVKARSYAATVVGRTAAKLGRQTDEMIGTSDLPLAIAVQSGASTAYFYPGFVLVVGSHREKFALVDLKDLRIEFNDISFTETEQIPTDAIMVAKAWAKSNKNGSRDKRFKHNRQLPVMRYGGLRLSSGGGLNESLMFSKAEACAGFVVAATELKQILTRGGPGRVTGRRSLPAPL